MRRFHYVKSIENQAVRRDGWFVKVVGISPTFSQAQWRVFGVREMARTYARDCRGRGFRVQIGKVRIFNEKGFLKEMDRLKRKGTW